MKKQQLVKVKTFDELLDLKYGKIGFKNRTDFEERAKQFVESETQKDTVTNNPHIKSK